MRDRHFRQLLTKSLACTMSVLLLLSSSFTLLPAYAEDDAPVDDAAAQTLDVSDEGTDNTETKDASDNGHVIHADDPTVPLTDIVPDGGIYSTLSLLSYDGSMTHISTNDPDITTQDYNPLGEYTEVALGVNIPVVYDLLDQHTHAQEGVVYTLDLPKEIVPAKVDAHGTEIINHTIEFESTSGVHAWGGIFEVDGGYQLKMCFSDIENKTDIAVSFRYSGTISSKDTKPGENTLSNLPGEPLRFNMAEPEPEVVASGGYAMSMNWSFKTPSYQTPRDWIESTVVVEDKKDKPLMDPMNLTIDFGTGAGLACNQSGNSIEDVLPLAVKVTYKDGTTETLRATRMGSLKYSFSSNKQSFDPTQVSTADSTHGTILTAWVDNNNSGEWLGGVMPGSNGNDGVSNKLHIKFGTDDSSYSKGDGKNDLGIVKYEFVTPLTIYNDWDIMGSSYSGTASMKLLDGKTMTTGTGTGNGFGSGSISESLSTTTSDSLAGVYPRYTHTLNYNGKNFYGNHYFIEFKPETNYTSRTPGVNAHHYMKNGAFVLDSSAGSSGHLSDTFSTFNVTTYNGNVLSMNDFHLHAMKPAYAYQYDGDIDAVARYQIQKISPNSSDYITTYRSNYKVDGRYVYIVMSPDTTEIARKARQKGWTHYSQVDSTVAPAVHIHVFNAPGSKVDATFDAYPGEIRYKHVYSSNGNGVNAGSYSDTFNSGVFVGYSSIINPSSNSHRQQFGGSGAGNGGPIYDSVHLDPVFLNDDVILWKVAIDVTNWADSYYRWQNAYNYESDKLYINVPQGQTLLTGSGGSLQSQNCVFGTFNPYQAYYMNPADGSSPVAVNAGVSTSGFSTGIGDTTHTRGTTLTSSYGGTLYELNLNNADIVKRTSKYNGAQIVNLFFATKATDSSVSYTPCTTEFAVGFNSRTYESDYRYMYRAVGDNTIRIIPASKNLSSFYNSGETDQTTTKMNWNVQLKSYSSTYKHPNAGGKLSDYTGYYSGNYQFHDDMKATEVSFQNSDLNEEQTQKVREAAAKATKLTMISFGGGGPNGSLGNGVGYMDLEKAAKSDSHQYVFNMGSTFTRSNGTSYYSTPGAVPATAVVTYNGNMWDGFDLDITGTNQIDGISISYTTEFDQKAFFEYLKEIDPSLASKEFAVTLKNQGNYSNWMGKNNSPGQASVYMNVAQELAVAKSTDGILHKDGVVDTNKYLSAPYKVKANVGYSDVAYVRLSDYLTWYQGKTKITDADAVAALAKAMTLSNVKITCTPPIPTSTSNKTSPQPVTIYENGAFKAEWSGSTFEKGSGASLFEAKLVHADGSKIPAGTHFEVSYVANLSDDRGEGSFLGSDYYEGGRILIANGVSAATPRVSLPKADAKKQNQAFSLLSADDDEPAVANDSNDEEELELVVHADADVCAEYLNEDVIYKQNIRGNEKHSEWAVYDWTGNAGKTAPTSISIADNLTAEITRLSRPEGMSDEEYEAFKNEIISILVKHATFSNVKVYYGKNKPTANDTPIWEHADAITKSETVDLQDPYSNLDVQYNPGSDAAKVKVTLNGNLDFDHYMSMTYDVDIDTEEFWKEIYHLPEVKKIGSLDLQYRLSNTAEGKESQFKSESKGSVRLLDRSVSKSLHGRNNTNSGANWYITANAGESKSPMVISDNLIYSLPKDTELSEEEQAKVIDALRQSTKITYMNISRNGYSIYRFDGSKGERKEIASKDDFLAEIATAFDGRDDGITLEAGSDAWYHFKFTDPNPTAKASYRIDYYTAIDTAKYYSLIGDLDPKFSIVNTAAIDEGFSSSAHVDNLKPDAPKEGASKTATKDSTNSGKNNYHATGQTLATGRYDFTMEDAPSSFYAGYGIKIDKSYFSLTDMKISVKQPNEEEVVYTPDNLPEGATLTDRKGEALKLNANGWDGWKLVFDYLPAESEVNVDYSVELDQAKFLKDNNRTDYTGAYFYNSLTVSSKDGSRTNTTPVRGVYDAHSELAKKGVVRYLGDSAVVEWSIDVNLNNQYSPEELAELDSVTITDKLNSKMTTPSAEDVQVIAYQDNTKVDAEVSTENHTLEVTVKNPSKTPYFKIYFVNSAKETLTDVENTAVLDVNGKKTETTSPKISKVPMGREYGEVRAHDLPDWVPTATKYIDDALCTIDGRFTFVIEETDENWNPLENGYSEEVTNKGDGSITFSDIRPTYKPVTHDRYFNVYEKNTNDADYSLDKTIYHVQLKPYMDEAQGIYLVNTVITSGAEEMVFVNHEKIDVNGKKTWNDYENRFNTRPENIKVHLFADGTEIDSRTVTAEDNWAWSFTKLEKYRDDGQEIEYTVTEDEVPGYKTTVKGYDITNDVITSESGSATLKIKKVREGNASIAVEGAVFELSNGMTATTDENGEASFTVPLDSEGPESFTLVETSAPAGYTKTDKVWNVTMTRDETPEVTLEENIFHLVWSWITDADSELEYKDGVLTIENAYTAKAATVELSAHKTLKGATLKADQFEFTLKSDDGTVIETVKNAEDGTITFAPLTFDEEGIYNYTVTEVAGSDSQIKYDSNVYKVKVTVTDDRKGNLIAEVESPEQGMEFTNTYTPEKPDTGDHNMLAIWAVIMLLASLEVAVLVAKRRRAVR